MPSAARTIAGSVVGDGVAVGAGVAVGLGVELGVGVGLGVALAEGAAVGVAPSSRLPTLHAESAVARARRAKSRLGRFICSAPVRAGHLGARVVAVRLSDVAAA
jgi:hypothetical protein